MAFKPSQFEGVANQVLAFFDQMEEDILSQMAKDADKGIRPDDNKLAFKFEQMDIHRRQIQRILDDYRKEGPKVLKRMTTRAYLTGMMGADEDLMMLGTRLPAGLSTEIIENTKFTDEFHIAGEFGRMHMSAINAMADELAGNIDNMIVQIARRENDIFKKVIQEVIGGGLGGIKTRVQMTQKAIDKFAGQGIGGFIDKAGRRWDIGSYAQMATRTAMVHASIQGHTNRLVEQGKDLVIVSSHQRACFMCRPWQRKILSISGKDPRYPSLEQAKSAGLYHPNCGHSISAYIEGLTEIDDEDDGTSHLYEEQQELRKTERNIRKWKKKEAMSVDPKAKAQAQAKIREWQGKAREIVDRTGIPRKYSNEKINKNTLKNLPKQTPITKKEKENNPTINKTNIANTIKKAKEKGINKDKTYYETNYSHVSRKDLEKYAVKVNSLSDEHQFAYKRYVRTGNSFKINQLLYTDKYGNAKRNMAQYEKDLRDMQMYTDEEIETMVARKGFDSAKSAEYRQYLKAKKKYKDWQIEDRMESYAKDHQFSEIDKLTDLINKHQLPEDSKYVRFVRDTVVKSMLESVGQKMDHTFWQKNESELNAMFSGMQWQNKGFTSMSFDINANVFTSCPIRMDIYVDKGTNAMVTPNWTESEVILNKGAIFEVVGVEMIDGKITLKMYMKGYGEV